MFFHEKKKKKKIIPHFGFQNGPAKQPVKRLRDLRFTQACLKDDPIGFAGFPETLESDFVLVVVNKKTRLGKGTKMQ